jgi:predicted O-methyltransferase YrrM
MSDEEITFYHLPWLTDTANSFLANLLWTGHHLKILEFGMGSSTLFFSRAEAVQHLVSVEHDYNYAFKTIKEQQKAFIPTIKYDVHIIPTPYHSICDKYDDDYFDIVLVDGRNRVKCIQQAIPKIKPGGILILDNSERDYYQPGILLLKTWVQTVFGQSGPTRYGFDGPAGWTTTIFFKPPQP